MASARREGVATSGRLCEARCETRRLLLISFLDGGFCCQGAPGLNGAWEVVQRINQKHIARNLRGAEANLWRQHDQEGANKR